MSKTRCIMVQGTMSGAGKSLLCTALCRIFHQDGLRCAPFKSQNMALNSYVTRDGLEMGRAQVVQAMAAGREPDVRMNPILLKPCSDVGSQVIVNGEVRGQMPARDYFRYKKQLVPEILAAYQSLAAENDVIVIEGAGSPAEINLKSEDIVNMGLAKLVDAPVLLAGDIDRGGVFAQLYGTVALLEPEERARIKGLVINKFRGDVEILRPGLGFLEQKTGVPVVGVVPYVPTQIDDEDSLAPSLSQTQAHKPLDAAVIRLPRISNFTDFSPLEQHPLLGVRYVGRPAELGTPDVVILPGTKSTLDDLAWLRQSGLEECRWWESAGATRCWAAPSRTPRAPRGAPPAPSAGGWGCCRWIPSSPPKRPAPGWRPRRWRGPLPGPGWRAMRSTWAGPPWRATPSAGWPTAGPRAARRAASAAPTSTVSLTPAKPPPNWRTPCAGPRALTRPGPSRYPTGLFRNRSLTVWPPQSGARWIWMPFTG